jgi:hypothetical protein
LSRVTLLQRVSFSDSCLPLKIESNIPREPLENFGWLVDAFRETCCTPGSSVHRFIKWPASPSFLTEVKLRHFASVNSPDVLNIDSHFISRLV